MHVKQCAVFTILGSYSHSMAAVICTTQRLGVELSQLKSLHAFTSMTVRQMYRWLCSEAGIEYGCCCITGNTLSDNWRAGSLQPHNNVTSKRPHNVTLRRMFPQALLACRSGCLSRAQHCRGLQLRQRRAKRRPSRPPAAPPSASWMRPCPPSTSLMSPMPAPQSSLSQLSLPCYCTYPCLHCILLSIHGCCISVLRGSFAQCCVQIPRQKSAGVNSCM